jgi:hypothetical protein
LVSAGFLGFRKRVRACVCSRALTGFREHVRVRARSRAGASLCFPQAPPCLRLLTAGEFAGRKFLPCRRGRECAVRLQDASFPFFCCVIPGLDPGISCKVGLRSPGHGLATGPVMTGVMEQSIRAKRGKRDCAPAGQAAPAETPPDREAVVSEIKGNTGHSILHRCFVFIGAQSSGPSGGDCTLPRSGCRLPERRSSVVQYATLPGRGGVGCP